MDAYQQRPFKSRNAEDFELNQVLDLVRQKRTSSAVALDCVGNSSGNEN